MKMRAKMKARKDVEKDFSDIRNYQVPQRTPEADAEIRQYLLDVIAWLDYRDELDGVEC